MEAKIGTFETNEESVQYARPKNKVHKHPNETNKKKTREISN